jgi:hypothetical protein
VRRRFSGHEPLASCARRNHDCVFGACNNLSRTSAHRCHDRSQGVVAKRQSTKRRRDAARDLRWHIHRTSSDELLVWLLVLPHGPATRNHHHPCKWATTGARLETVGWKGGVDGSWCRWTREHPRPCRLMLRPSQASTMPRTCRCCRSPNVARCLSARTVRACRGRQSSSAGRPTTAASRRASDGPFGEPRSQRLGHMKTRSLRLSVNSRLLSNGDLMVSAF